MYEVEKISHKVIFLKNGKYQDNESQSETENPNLIVEIDTDNSREELLQVFQPFTLEKLNFNGGIFVAYFSPETELSDVLTAIGNSKIQVTYIRNISTSTRRFFVE
ncbi:ABC-2 type transport system ATP-binding protein [Epilithonimonas hominis]|uniref:ABC-2 type transport system ATP-binding protein n=1 Tax=Epilithonimonas hominis TaxID=420404 RepID=A0A1H6JYF9_9FLAO|nr:ABC-2 type transport system ATP-binding protein [Epilithonimonas hominis]